MVCTEAGLRPFPALVFYMTSISHVWLAINITGEVVSACLELRSLVLLILMLIYRVTQQNGKT